MTDSTGKNRYSNKIVLVSLLATLGVAPTYAEAHGGDGWWILPAMIGGALIYDAAQPHYYPPQTVYVQQPVYVPQPVYVQQPIYVQQPYSQASGYEVQSTRPPAAQPVPVWYYCESSKGYYPYVNACPEGWKMVPSVPPSASEQAPSPAAPPPPR